MSSKFARNGSWRGALKPSLLGLLSLLVGGTFPLHAAALKSRVQSEDNAIFVETDSAELSEATLKVVSETQRQLRAAFDFPFPTDSRLLVRIEPEISGQTARAPQLSAWLDDRYLNLQVTAFQGSPTEPQSFLRKVVLAIFYQAIFPERAQAQTLATLPGLPVWLVEGAQQTLIDAGHEQNARIVQRAHFVQHTPTLATIIQLPELSAEKLERTWQQAFCYQALQFALVDADRLAGLKAWLRERGLAGASLSAPWPLDENLEKSWQESQDDPRINRGPLIYSWERTAAELAAAQSIVLPEQGEQKEALTNLRSLGSQKNRPDLAQVLQQKIIQLTVLELRAHFVWRPVIRSYRLALLTLLDPKKSAAYPRVLAQAEADAVKLNDLTRRVSDYLNWFEVTQQISGPESAFTSYFRLQDEVTAFSRGLETEPDEEMVKIERRM